MKKVCCILILLLFVFMPILVNADDYCTTDDIEIKSIDIIETNGIVEEIEKPSFDNLKINFNVKFYNAGSSVKYKIIINNKTEQGIKINNGLLTTDNEFMNYEVSSLKDMIYLRREGEIYLKITYENAIDRSKLPNQIYNHTDNFDVNLLFEDLDRPYFNGWYIVIIMSIAILLVAILSMSIYLKNNKKVKQNITLIIITLLLFIPNCVTALCSNGSINVISNIIIDDKNATFINGEEFNVKMKKLANNGVGSVESTDRNILAINYSKNKPSDDKMKDENLVSIKESNSPIYIWYDSGTIYWWSEDETPSFNENASSMFRNLLALTDISGIVNMDTSHAINFFAIFANDMSIDSYEPIKDWNVSKVETMECAFLYNRNIENLNGLENWDVSSLKNMSDMLRYNDKLNNIDAIKNWNVSSVENMQSLFSSCFSLEEIDLSNWETSSLTNLSNTFGMWASGGKTSYSSKLKRIIISDKFDTSKVTQMLETFANLTLLEDYAFLELFDTSNVTTMKQLFQSNYKLTDLSYIKNWNVSNVVDMTDAFSFCTGLTSLSGLENWNVSKVETMSRTFVSDYKLTDISAIKSWNVSNVKIMNYLFANCYRLVDASPINDWNIVNVTDFNSMFYGDYSVNLPVFSKVKGTWDNNKTFVPTV